MDPIFKSLSEQRQDAGEQILLLTDGVGLNAQAAGWVLIDDTWRYIIATPMVDQKGPRWVIQRLLKVFRVLKLPEGVTPLDITITSFDASPFRLVPFTLHAIDPVNLDPIRAGFITAGVPPMLLYRMLLPAFAAKVTNARRFDERVMALAA